MYVGAMEMFHPIPTLLGVSFVAFVNVYSPTSSLIYLFNFSIPWVSTFASKTPSTMVLVTPPWFL
jgi:hypothetical protein